jgi:formate-nitrite transporter family protein
MTSKFLTKRIILWGSVIVGLALALFAVSKLAVNGQPIESGALAVPVSDADWSRGPANAKVVLVEYGDFQCPACGAYHPVLTQLENEYPNDLKVIYRHFPLYRIHPNAGLAARATEAAGLQGKFWEMHDMIFESQPLWSQDPNAKDLFIEYAGILDLDLEKFTSDLDAKATKEGVDEDYEGGIRARVDSTPTFFLNGMKIENPRSYDEFKELLEQAINANS